MSAFADLIRESEGLGVDKLTWHCDVRGFTADELQAGRWACLASGPGVVVPCRAVGRTGEEALREVVAFLRRVG